MTLEELRKKRVGLALGVGGARGASHLGVMRSLRKNGIKVSCVAGASSGSVFGAVLASDVVDEAADFISHLSWWQILRTFLEFRLPRYGGLLTGKHSLALVKRMVPCRDFAELKIPLSVVAADLFTGEEVVISEGDLMEAIHASCAVPGLNCPVQRNERWLVDGGLVNPLPISVCRRMGAEVVIGVDVNLGRNFQRSKPPPRRPTFPNVFFHTCRLIENEWTKGVFRTDPPDILIQPPVGHIYSMQIRQIKFAIRAGEIATDNLLRNLSAGS